MRFRRRRLDPRWGPRDQGSGSLDDYKFDLLPASSRVTIRLAGSDAHQDLIAGIEAAEIQAAIARRTAEEERTDAPIVVRLFAGGRVIGPVGEVPRGLEGPVSEAITRLELAGRTPRIPVAVVSTRYGLRVDLLIGRTR